MSSVQQLAQKQKANAATVVKQKRAASRQPTQQAQAEVYDLWGEKGMQTGLIAPFFHFYVVCSKVMFHYLQDPRPSKN